jgi:hypothetical protein
VSAYGSVTLDGSRSSDPDAGDSVVSYEWDLDSDGTYGETGDSAERGDERGAAPTFCATGLVGSTTRTVWLRVADGHGGTSSPQSAHIVVGQVLNWQNPANPCDVNANVHRSNVPSLGKGRRMTITPTARADRWRLGRGWRAAVRAAPARGPPRTRCTADATHSGLANWCALAAKQGYISAAVAWMGQGKRADVALSQ